MCGKKVKRGKGQRVVCVRVCVCRGQVHITPSQPSEAPHGRWQEVVV